MLEVKNIYKEFEKINKDKVKEKFYADNDISFTLDKGMTLGILGPNGAGKTTLLRMLAGIMEPTKGSITYDGVGFHDDEIKLKKDIAYLSGNTKLYNNFSCVELLRMCNNIYGVNKEEGEKRIKEVIDKLGMNDYANSRIGNLSTGQTQKVNIARCLVHDPKYYILDEATSGLDIVSSQIILDFIKEEKKRGKTILYSTHYMEEAENICDYIIMLNKGVVIKEGTPLKIKEETNTSNLRDAFFKVLGDDSNE
jgi:sodium transport system ATP-binding protein